MQNGAFTQKLEDEFRDNYIKNFIDDYAEEDDDKGDVIKELNEKSKAISFGYALKRFVCEKYGTYRECDKKYICAIDDKLFELDNYDEKECSNEEYAELISYLRKKNGVPEKDAPINSIVSWLNTEHKGISRDIVFRLAFILEMNELETEKFLTKVIFEQSYNFRDAEEIVYRYCHANNLNLSTAENLIRQGHRNIGSRKNVIKEDKEDVTLGIKKEILKLKGEDDLIDYLIENEDKLSSYRMSIKREYDKLLDDIIKLLTLENEIYCILPAEGLENDRKTKIKISDNYLDSRMFSWRPFENEGKKKKKLFKESQLHESILCDLPTKDIISKIRKGAVIKRKAILYLRFYKYSLITIIANYIIDECSIRAQSVFKYLLSHIDDDFDNIQDKFKELVDDEFKQLEHIAGSKEKECLAQIVSTYEKIREKDEKEEKEKIEDLIDEYMEAGLLNKLLELGEAVEDELMKPLINVLIMRQEEFRDEADDKLEELGMGRMYIGNEFDKLILMSIKKLNPYEFFSDVLSQSFEK